jgi:hypothetical protein
MPHDPLPVVVCVFLSQWTHNGQQRAEADDCFAIPLLPGDALGRSHFAKSDRQSWADRAIMLKGSLRHCKPSFSATIISTLKMAVELANAASASYAIASNGLCR